MNEPRCGGRCSLRNHLPGAEPGCVDMKNPTRCVFYDAQLQEEFLHLAKGLQEREEMIAIEARLAELRAKFSSVEPAAMTPALPTPLQVARFDSLVDTVTDAVEQVAKGTCSEMGDIEHCVFEAAVEAVYGKGIWTWWREAQP